MGSGRPFQKGKSGNPGGRPSVVPAIAKKILAETRNGEELVDILLSAARGQHKDLLDERSRRWAIDTLLDRCLGKAAQIINVTTGDVPKRVPYEVLTDVELEQYEALTAKLAEAAAASEPSTPPAATLPEGAGGDGGDGGSIH